MRAAYEGLRRRLLSGCAVPGLRGLALVAGLLVAPTVQAQTGRCTTEADCVAEAECLQGSCRLLAKRFLYPAVGDLTELNLIEPAQLAIIPDGQPSLRWQYPLGADLVAVAIFPKMPVSSDAARRISNFDSARWVWHSNLPGFEPGSDRASFADGRKLATGGAALTEPLSEELPQALASGTYYWAAWGWSGRELRFRSEIRAFAVPGDSVTGTRCDAGDNRACGELSTTVCLDAPEGPVPRKRPMRYCALKCASDLDCFGRRGCNLSTATGLPWGLCQRDSGGCQCGPAEECDTRYGICYSNETPTITPMGCGCASRPLNPPMWVGPLLLFAVCNRRARRLAAIIARIRG